MSTEVPLLALSAEEGYGYFPASPGLLLKDGRYEVARMLGTGQTSSVFLIRDLGIDGIKPNTSYALKILTAHATQINRQGRLQELETLQAIAKELKSTNFPPYLPELIDHFETTGPHGDHLCFVLRLRSTNVSTFRRTAPSRRLLLHDVKVVVLHTLHALEIMHKLGMIHTDVKPSDIVLVPGVENPVPAIIEGEIEFEGKIYPIMKAQPLPHNFLWDGQHLAAESRIFCLNDLGHAISADREKNYELGTPYALRAPEIILQAGYDSKIDIWAVGCMAFELLTGCWAFHPKAGPAWSMEDEHLVRMVELTGETFNSSMLARSELRDEFFDEDGKLKVASALDALGIHQALMNYKVLSLEDSKAAAEFIATCLHLDPAERPSAHDLSHHSWLEGAD